MTEDFQQKLAAAIVPIEIDVVSATGKLKLGQHKPENSQHHVFEQLKQSDNLDSQHLAQLMADLNIGTGQS